MLKIFKVRILDEAGRSTVMSAYFLDKKDAEVYREINDPKKELNTSSIDEFNVWEKNEYSAEKDIKIRALSKLTTEERKVLGLE